jgi:hypothetical protein
MTLRLGFVAILLVGCGRAPTRVVPQDSRVDRSATIDRFAGAAGLRAVSCNTHGCCSALLGDKPVMFFCGDGSCKWVNLESFWNRPFAC